MSKHDDDCQMMACIADRNVWPAGGFDSFRSPQHENGQVHGRPGTKRRQGLFVCSVSALALLLATAPAWADGGAGGAAAGGGSTGGAGGTATQPNGRTDIDSFGSGGGGGGVSSTNGHGGAGGAGGDDNGPGGSGGAGGAPALVTMTDDANTSALTGVPGGRGANGSGAPSGGGGGGGGGGFGWVVRGAGNASNAGTITGGAGGTGGHDGGGGAAGGGGGGQGGGGVLLTGGGRLSLSVDRVVGGAGGAGGPGDFALSFAGTGGDGGHGVLLTAGGDVTNTAGAAIAGGAGGSGGNTADVVGGQGGTGGTGLAGTDFTLINRGQITGGTGGAGGSSSTAADGNAGDGGAGVSGGNLTITNSGSISGGMSGDGSTQADAIRFTGGTNRLELRAGSRIDGNVVATGDDTLALGGSDDASFNLDQIGAGNQYQGFTTFEKTGTSTWALTGTAETGLFDFAEGTVAVTDGGTLSQPGYILGGRNYVGRQSGDDASLIITNGGTVSTANWIAIGHFADSQGSVTVSGSRSSLNTDWLLTVGDYGEGLLSVASGGHVSVNNSLFVGGGDGSGSGVLSVTGDGSKVDAPEVQIAQYVNGATGTVTLSDGGTLESSRRVAMALHNSDGSATLNIGANSVDPGDAVAPGVFDTPELQFYEDSAHLNFNHTGTAYHFDAALVSGNDGAGVVNHYAGTTILTGDSATFSGDTVVHGGTLAVDGTLGNAASVTTVASGGTLGGSGSTGGAVTVADGGTLSVAAGQTLGMGSLALSSGSNVDVALGAPGDTALFDVNGDLTLDGSLNVSDAGGFGAGVYRIFDYGGDLTDNGLAIGTTPGGTTADNLRVQTAAANQVNLVSTAGLALGFWDGGDAANRDNAAIDGGSGTWQVGDSHWTGMDGAINGPYQPNPTFAVFQGQSGTVTVDDGPGAIQVTGLQFASDGYKIEGDAIELTGDDAVIRVGDGTQAGADTTATIDSRLAGAGGLNKTDLGTLILTGNNAYTGGTQIDAGRVVVASGATLGTGPVVVDGNGAVGMNNVLDVYGDISGLGITNQAQRAGAVNIFQGASVGAAQIDNINGSGTVFHDGASAEQATITNSGAFSGVSFVGADAGSATITNTGGNGNAAQTIFADAASGNHANAGTATITNANNGTTEFRGLSSAGHATLINEDGGSIEFQSASTADNATIDNGAGGKVFVRTRDSGQARLAIGSLSGAGDVQLEGRRTAGGGRTANTLALGGLGRDDTIGGVISDPRRLGNGLAKIGTGTLTLNGVNTYTGITEVEDGTLLVGDDSHTAAAIAGDAQVDDGATLGGAGTINGVVTIADGGTLAGTAGQTLDMGYLALSSGSKLDVALGTPNDTALFDVAHDVTLDGTLDVTDAGGFGAGVYRLADYGGTLTDNGLEVGTTPAGTLADDLVVQTAAVGQINLINTDGQALRFWDGSDAANRGNDAIDGGSGTWRAAGDANWTVADAAFNGPYLPKGAFAVFAGQAGDITVDNGNGAINITGLQFASDGYQVVGDAITLKGADGTTAIRVGDGTQAGAAMTATIGSALTGDSTLVKTDGGTLVLSASNTYNGGTTIEAGTLQLGTGGSIAGDVTNNAILSFGGSDTSSFGGVISGTGELHQTGSGTTTLTHVNTYSGGTSVETGTLRVANTGALGTGPVRIDGPLSNTALRFDGAGVSAGNLSIDNNAGNLVFAGGATAGQAAIDNNVAGYFSVFFRDDSDAGDATIDNRGAATRFEDQASAGDAMIVNHQSDAGTSNTTFAMNATAGSATLVNESGTTTVFTDDSTADDATVINRDNGFLDIRNHAGGLSIGSVSGNGVITLGANALTVGALGNDDTIGGFIDDGGNGGSLIKAGTGTLTLNGVNTYSGGTTVNAGTLAVDSTVAGDASVAAGATLSGSGKIDGSVTVADGGTLAGASGQTLGLGALSLASGAHVDVSLDAPSDTTLFDVAGDLTLHGTLNVDNGGAFGGGVYRIIDYGGALTDNGLDIGSVPMGTAAVNLALQTAVDGQVNLINTANQTLNFWDGSDAAHRGNGAIDGGSGTWQVGDRSWTGMDGAANGPYQPNPTFAIFEGNAGTVTVDDAGGAITVTGLQFASDGYRITGDAIGLDRTNTVVRVGDGSAAGADLTATIDSVLTGGGLDKTDLGTLILTGANSYTGGTTLSAGTLSVSADANLGDAAGNIVFAGGQLASTQSFDSARAGTLDADGRVAVAAGTTLGLSGNLTGPGNLVKTGDGVLNLTGSNAYGDTQVAAGRLEGDAASISGNIASAGTVVFDQGDDATFAGDISGLNDTDGTLVKRGAGELTLTGTSVLDTTIAAGGLISATDRFGGDLDIASGAQMTFDQSYNGAYAGTLAGDGNLLFAGGGAVGLMGDNSGFAGTTTVEGSTLVVNETLGGILDIATGGRLQGNGTVGDTTIADGGTVAPGNSIGTLHVNGDITFAPGARYEVEVDPTGADSDLIAATGTANIGGGAVAHIGADGHYDPTSTYTILTADNGVNGTFDSVASDFTFLDAILGYDANDVTLTLQRNDIAFVDSADTRNQRAAARGADSLTFGDPLYDRVVQLDDPSARRAFDLLSGEVHASTRTALIQDSRYLRQAMLQRLRNAPASDATASDEGSAHWMRAIGAFGGSDSDGNAAGLDRSTRGFLLGGDTQLADYWRVGATAGFTRTDFDADARQSSGDSDNYHLGIYTGTQATPVRFTLGAGYSWHDIKSQRSVAFPGLTDRLQSAHHAATAQVFGELGYAIDFGTTEVEPFANVAYVNLDSDGFTEHGGAAALHVDGDNTDTTFSTLGLRLARTLELKSATIALHTSAGWRHAYGDTTPTVTNAYAGSSNFTVAGVPIEDDSAVVDAGLSVGIADNTTLGLSYGGLFGSDVHDNSGTLDLTVRF